MEKVTFEEGSLGLEIASIVEGERGTIVHGVTESSQGDTLAVKVESLIPFHIQKPLVYKHFGVEEGSRC